MTISKMRLRRIIREEAKSTAKYDEDKHLTPKQGKELPDAMQKGIIDKEKEEEAEEKNEALKRRLRRVIKEEAADCYSDYRAGGLSYADYQDCLKRFADDEDDYRPRYQRKTSYVGKDANKDQIATVEAILAKKPNNFLKSVLGQLKRGRGLSSKQKSIVRKIVTKSDPTAAALFERHGLKMKMKSILNEVMAECPKDLKLGMPCPIKTAEQMHMSGADDEDIMKFVGDLLQNFENPPHPELQAEPGLEPMLEPRAQPMLEPLPPEPFTIDTMLDPVEEPISLEKDPLYDEVEELVGAPPGGG